MKENPYAVDVDLEPSLRITADSEVELIRRQHLSHEASIKSIGFLYILGGFIGAFVSLSMLVEMIGSAGASGTSEDIFFLVFALGMIALTGVHFWAGFGLRKLSPPARIAGIVLSVIGLLGFPIGTILSLYFLYLLASNKGSYVFSDEYKQVIAATPHLRYRTSIIVWVLLGLFVVLVVLALLSPVLSRL